MWPRLLAACLLLAISSPPASAAPVALRPDIQVRKVAEVDSWTVRIAKDPRDHTLYLLNADGTIRRVDGVEGGSARLQVLYTAADHGGAAALGFAIGPDGTMYLVSNDKQGGRNTVSILKGVIDPQTGERVWSTLARTEPYPISDTAFDHDFNGIVVSPDNRFVYVNSGSRTDHGEVEDNKGKFPGLREIPLTSAIFRLPTDGEGIVLPDDEEELRAAGYLFADGVRNTFDMAFAPDGELFGAENGPDRDTPEELNWLRAGHHYGFPWRLADEDNPQQFPGYDPDEDQLVRERSTAFRLGSYHNDPSFPPPPGAFTDPVVNTGPDADQFRDPQTGAVKDAGDLGMAVRTFTPHRSPLGLVFDTEGALAPDLRGGAFLLNIGQAIAADLNSPFPPNNDLLHVELEKKGEGYEARTHRMVADFQGPIDAEIIGHKIYVVEFSFNDRRGLWEITLPQGGDEGATRIERVADHRGWGWEAWVLRNGLIELAAMPAIGGRVMQYDLEGHSSLFVNPAETGKVYEPAANAPWRNFGGYKLWPAPQERWSWPPPPVLDSGMYTARIAAETPDSVALFLSSPREQWQTPDLRFERRLSIYRGSSRVRLEQTLINEGATPQRWSVWDVTQSIVHHPGESDYDHFRVYFPLNPDSRYGAAGVRVSAESEAWLGKVAPGIFGVWFRPEDKKIFADVREGWICYVDERDGYAYAKTFAVFAGREYPDQGARAEVWVNRDPRYLEVEVLSPLAELSAGGGRYTFVEDWWATRLRGPVLEVNRAGAVARRLAVELAASSLTGTYGVFHQGTAQVVLTDRSGSALATGKAHPVSPTQIWVLEEQLPLLEQAAAAEVRLTDAQGRFIGMLDTLTLPPRTAVLEDRAALPTAFALEPSYPNPFNASVVIPYRVPAGEHQVELSVYSAAGVRIRTLVRGKQGGGGYAATWDSRDAFGRAVASGVYFYRLVAEGSIETRKMVLIR